jgi:hypothetical protein
VPPRGRPRLTHADYEERLRAYCGRYDVPVTPAGIPPFPTGRRETDQHREWMALYRTHSRLNAPRAAAARPAAHDGTCPVCGRLLEPAEAVTHGSSALHPGCHAVVSAVEPLGAAGFERLRAFLWPDARRRPGRKPSRSGR